jgi:hypothetical protein
VAETSANELARDIAHFRNHLGQHFSTLPFYLLYISVTQGEFEAKLNKQAPTVSETRVATHPQAAGAVFIGTRPSRNEILCSGGK